MQRVLRSAPRARLGRAPSARPGIIRARRSILHTPSHPTRCLLLSAPLSPPSACRVSCLHYGLRSCACLVLGNWRVCLRRTMALLGSVDGHSSTQNAVRNVKRGSPPPNKTKETGIRLSKSNSNLRNVTTVALESKRVLVALPGPAGLCLSLLPLILPRFMSALFAQFKCACALLRNPPNRTPTITPAYSPTPNRHSGPTRTARRPPAPYDTPSWPFSLPFPLSYSRPFTLPCRAFSLSRRR